MSPDGTILGSLLFEVSLLLSLPPLPLLLNHHIASAD